MLARCSSASIQGMDAHPVTVEVDLAPGLPGLQLVGLPDTAIQESRERVRAALRNSGFRGPLVRVIVNLAPADLRKEDQLSIFRSRWPYWLPAVSWIQTGWRDFVAPENLAWTAACDHAAAFWRLPAKPRSSKRRHVLCHRPTLQKHLLWLDSQWSVPTI